MRRKEPRPPLDLETVVIVHGCGCRMAGKTHPELNVCCSEHFIWWPEHPAYIADLFIPILWQRYDERYRELIYLGFVK